MGKTFSDAEKAGTLGVLVDLKGVLTMQDMIGRIDTAYRTLRSPLARGLRGILASIDITFSGGVGPVAGTVGARSRAAADEAALFRLLDLPNKIAAKGVARVIVCFDEFQDVLSIPSADDKLRSRIQHHDEFAAYIFAGSEPRLMNELFSTDRSRGFWDQARALTLGPLDRADAASYIDEKFGEAGKDPGDALGHLLDVAQGHPQRTMLLAHMLWERTPRGGTADTDTWAGVLRDTELDAEPAHEALWRGLPLAHQRTLRAIALFEGHPHRVEAARHVGLARGSVAAAVDALAEQYVIHQVGDGTSRFVDPLFEIWVRNVALARLPQPGSGGNQPGLSDPR